MCGKDTELWVGIVAFKSGPRRPLFYSQFSSVAQSCPTLCDPMDCSTPSLPGPSPTPRVYSNSCPLSLSNHLILCRPIIDRVIFPQKPEESQGAVLRDPGEEYCRHTRASVAGAEEARGQ